MTSPTEADLKDAIEEANQKAIESLFRRHDEDFYYCSLITSGEAHAPTLTAWSKEALSKELRKNPSISKHDLEWSYGESPYFGYGEEYFGTVKDLFARRPQPNPNVSDAEWQNEYDIRLRAMEVAMRDLDQKGLFGTGRKRLGIVINVEVMPPDFTNTERAIRLNPAKAITTWLKDVAEPMPSGQT